MNKQKFSWFVPFFAISIVHLISILLQWDSIVTGTKPLLMLSLLLAVQYALPKGNESHNEYRPLALALIFSFLGDVFLLAEHLMAFSLGFYLGLGSFLIAHIFYILLFLKLGGIKISGYWAIAYVLYYLVFMALLYPGLPFPLKLAVSLYGAVLCVMAWNSWRGMNIENKIGWMLIFGSFLFVVSDSLLAFNRFKWPVPYAGFLIMISYLGAQFFISLGIIRRVS